MTSPGRDGGSGPVPVRARAVVGWVLALALPVLLAAATQNLFDSERFGVGALLILTVMVAGLVAGTAAAVTAGVVATLALDWFLIEPSASLAITDTEDRAATAVFGLAAVAVAFTSGAVEAARRRATVAAQRLAFQSALLTTQSEAGIEGQLIVSPSGEILSYNSRFAEMWKFPDELVASGSDDEALSQAMTQVVDPEAFIERVRECYANPTVEVRDDVRFTDGRVFDRWGAPLRDDEGTYLGWAWYFRDVTDHVAAEAALRAAGRGSAGLARTLQRSLLPPTLPRVPGLDLAARYHPAGAGLDVGGDFYDVFALDDTRWGFTIGDVCGKGAAAATITAAARHAVRAISIHATSPSEVLRQLNETMLIDDGTSEPDDVDSTRFCTIVYATGAPVERGGFRFELAVGGHPLPFVRRVDGTVDRAGRSGSLVGTLPAIDVTDEALDLGPGDVAVFVTDGILEARSGSTYLDDEALTTLLRLLPDGEDAAAVAARIEAAALDIQGGMPHDDIAILVLRAT